MSKYLSRRPRVLDALAGAGRVYMSVFVLGELSGRLQVWSRWRKQNGRSWRRFLAKPSVEVLEATRETAEYFGLIKAALKKAGRPIPLNDVWIAAHALETGSVLVTYDTHFAAVPGLRIWDEL